MSTILSEEVPMGEPPSNLLFDYRGADVILRSQDLCHFRVPKTSIINNSPTLGEIIQRTLDSSSNANPNVSLPVVQLPERGEILRCLLTFIYPVPPLLPSTPEEIMELLFVAQKYRMEVALTHIRGSISRQNALPTHLEPTLHTYALAQKYGLRPEALQTARAILLKQSFFSLEDLDNKFDIMSGASLYELWNYYKRVEAILASDLADFTMSGACGTLSSLQCTNLGGPSRIPKWLHGYITAIATFPHLFDSIEFHGVMAHHITNQYKTNGLSCGCESIPSQTIREFWEALASVVHSGFEEAGLALSLVREREDTETQINPATSLLEHSELFDVPDANFIIRSSDNVNFRVHKPILAMASPFFKDLLSLPQPSDSETVDELPVVQLSESSDLLKSLVSMLYPVPPVIPNSFDKVFYLLAACQKYELTSVQSSIRAKVKLGEFPAPKGAEAFPAYAIASAKGLIPETRHAARLTLDSPISFDVLGEGLRLFEGCALRDLVDYRRRCRDSLIACLDSFLDTQPSGPSSIWFGCPEVLLTMPPGQPYFRQTHSLPRWIYELLWGFQSDLEITFTHPLNIHSRIRREYFAAFQNHATCSFCSGVNRTNGIAYCAELENKLAQAINKVRGDRGSHSSCLTDLNSRSR